MPGKGIMSPAEVPGSPSMYLLKSHKALPKKRIIRDAVQVPTTTSHPHVYDLDREGYSSSERIRSWIPEPSSVERIPDPGLPLTPPLNASEAHIRIPIARHSRNESALPTASIQTTSSGITTPVLQRSPPTPETTPPKFDEHNNTSGSSNPYLSSARTESFETALEDQISNGDLIQLESPSLRPSRQTWLKSAGHTAHQTIGLGLGLEHEDGVETPTGTMEQATPGREDLISFEGAWSGNTPEMNAVKGGADLTFRSGLRQHGTKRSRISEQLLETPLIDDKGTPLSAARSVSLPYTTRQTKQNAPATPRETRTENIRWPLQDNGTISDEQSREADDRRFSQISTTSTIVEAMVFDTPPQRPPRMHISMTVDDWSDTRKVQLVAKGHLLFQARVAKKKVNRQGKNNIWYRLLTYALTQSSKPTTILQNAIGYSDVPQPERRTASAHVPISPPKADRKAENDTPVANLSLGTPPSSHVLNNMSISRATSNASGPVESIGPPTRQQSRSGYHVAGFPNSEIFSPDEESNGDWSALRPHSSIVTPFSLRSARSSTPGTLEINEATAISIYPHTNKSILVVQHAARRDSQQPPGHSAIIASNAKFAIPAGSVQPPVIHQPRQLLDSPLQNPRSPPQPPDFKIIPPTPANVTDNNTSPDRQGDTPSSELNPPKRRLSTRVKRAFSTRRYSDVFAAVPLKRTLSLSSQRNTTTTTTGNSNPRRASTGLDLHRNLHPLWRPRAFWNDKDDGASDSDSEFGNDGFLVGNSLGMPSDGVKMFDPPRTTKRRGSLSRRFGSLRFPGRRRSESMSEPHHHRLSYQSDGGGGLYGDFDGGRAPPAPTTTMTRRFSSTKGGFGGFVGRRNRDGNESYEFIQRPMREEQQQGAGAVPRLGYQVQFVGFKGLAEKVKERREKARREKVRERLRGSIDVLRGV
ncbi:MAG: hypothetical protein Q9220_002500 [cf. Caloplaca sp. 1 TL-2023]